ncbi:MAG: hypothetical protein IK100_05785 [Muribaculaceae bacterium]|nr:hypothetical protein [Muribaculaceae bacterium]
MKNAIELTTTEFRKEQKKWLDLAAQGASILICRGKELFMLNKVPTSYRLDEETLQIVEEGLQEYKAGKTTTINNEEELNQFLDSL